MDNEEIYGLYECNCGQKWFMFVGRYETWSKERDIKDWIDLLLHKRGIDLALLDSELLLHIEGDHFKDATLYTTGTYGVQRVDCKEIVVKQHVQYEQYDDAVEIIFLEKGKRKLIKRMLTKTPYLMVVSTREAITLPSEWDQEVSGELQTRYASFDKRWLDDWREQSKHLKPLLLIDRL